MSLGLDSTVGDVDLLAEALLEISSSGPRWRYRRDEDTGEYVPDPDTRSLASVPFPASSSARSGESS
jgi:hypothetical protein